MFSKNLGKVKDFKGGVAKAKKSVENIVLWSISYIAMQKFLFSNRKCRKINYSLDKVLKSLVGLQSASTADEIISASICVPSAFI